MIMQLETCFITRSLAAQGAASVCADVQPPRAGTLCLFIAVQTPSADREEVFVFLPRFSLAGPWSSRSTKGPRSSLLISRYRSPPGSALQPGARSPMKAACTILCLTQRPAGLLACCAPLLCVGMGSCKQGVETENY